MFRFGAGDEEGSGQVQHMEPGEILSVGAFPHHQSGGQDAHVVGLARQHPELHPRVGWQVARRSRARPPPSRGQALLLPEAGAIYVMDRGYVAIVVESSA
jgi:hypothetical protein